MGRAQQFIIAAALGIPMPLHGQPVPGDTEIDCVYRRAAAADLLIGWEMDRAPHPADAAEDAALDRDASAAGACAAEHHWPDAKIASAITYAMARATLDAAVRDLSMRGIAPNIVYLVAADIGARGRAALGGSSPTDADFQAVAASVARNLARTHAPVRSGSPELAEAGRLIARGLHAMLVRDQAIAAFAEP